MIKQTSKEQIEEEYRSFLGIRKEVLKDLKKDFSTINKIQTAYWREKLPSILGGSIYISAESIYQTKKTECPVYSGPEYLIVVWTDMVKDHEQKDLFWKNERTKNRIEKIDNRLLSNYKRTQKNIENIKKEHKGKKLDIPAIYRKVKNEFNK